MRLPSHGAVYLDTSAIIYSVESQGGPLSYKDTRISLEFFRQGSDPDAEGGLGVKTKHNQAP